MPDYSNASVKVAWIRRFCWKNERRRRPKADSLRLLPSGPDRVGERFVHRRLPRANIQGHAAEYESRSSPERIQQFDFEAGDIAGVARHQSQMMHLRRSSQESVHGG